MKQLSSSFFDFFLFFTLTLFAVVLAFGGKSFSVVNEGISLWAACVLPALFPYFFITAIVTKLSSPKKMGRILAPLTKTLFNTGGVTGYAFLISVVSGYPIGAAVTCELKKNNLLSDAEAVRCSAVCSTSSPMFLTGSVGAIMFGDKTFGLRLFLCHLISAVINGFIFSFYKRKEKPYSSTAAPYGAHVDGLLYEGVYSSVISVLTVGGMITLFYLITHLLLAYGILNPAIYLVEKITGDARLSVGIVSGLFECTTGLKQIASCGITFFTLPTVAAVCGFGGVSVILQSTAYLKKTKIKVAPFVLSKLSGAAVNFIVGLLFSLFFYP